MVIDALSMYCAVNLLVLPSLEERQERCSLKESSHCEHARLASHEGSFTCIPIIHIQRECSVATDRGISCELYDLWMWMWMWMLFDICLDCSVKLRSWEAWLKLDAPQAYATRVKLIPSCRLVSASSACFRIPELRFTPQLPLVKLFTSYSYYSY